jgi:leucine dehydrogenase
VLFDTLEELGLRKLVVVSDPPSGLRAMIAIHDTTLGPAAGGVRTRAYPDEWSALREVAALARTMTYKCALAGLPCGGGKAVVMDHPDLDRTHAFEVLGEAIESLGGLFRTAGDLGTHESELRAIERRTQYVSCDPQGIDLEGATARGVLLAMREAASFVGIEDLHGLDVIVQGVGSIGSVLVRDLVESGARVRVTDTDPERLRAVAEAYAVETVDAAVALETPCDVFAPCAISSVVDESVAQKIPARILCGAANNPLADDSVADALAARNVLYVPDFVANAGGVIEGMGDALLELEDRSALIERIAETTRKVLEAARDRHDTPLAVAHALARERIDEAMPKWRRRG